MGVVEESVQALTALGFTGLEAEVYALLLRESPATGYRVAQALAKPAANVYKALDSLGQKGALLVDEGASRVYRAVPAPELLARLERSFAERRTEAERALAELQGSDADDRVYQLNTRDQVLERCRAMLARARRTVVCDIFPVPLDLLKHDFETVAARDVKTTVKVFAPTDLSGPQVIVNVTGEAVMDLFPGQWIILIVDGAELLLAFLSPDGTGVHQAVWSGSAYIAFLFHCSFVSELGFHALLTHLGSAESPSDEVRAALGPLRGQFAIKDLPGYEALLARFGPVPHTKETKP